MTESSIPEGWRVAERPDVIAGATLRFGKYQHWDIWITVNLSGEFDSVKSFKGYSPQYGGVKGTNNWWGQFEKVDGGEYITEVSP